MDTNKFNQSTLSSFKHIWDIYLYIFYLISVGGGVTKHKYNKRINTSSFSMLPAMSVSKLHIKLIVIKEKNKIRMNKVKINETLTTKHSAENNTLN